jgi:hypothetical protein
LNLPVIPLDKFQFEAFDTYAKATYSYQLSSNSLYQTYVRSLISGDLLPPSIESIPFLPIRFFKTHRVVSGACTPDEFFESSGTTGQSVSKHYIKDLHLYETSFMTHFLQHFGHPSEYCIIGLLPSYLERNHSSLVYMVNHLLKESGHPSSGFYLHNHAKLFSLLSDLEKKDQRVMLFGTTFALLDFAEVYAHALSNTIIIETGGMKGRREELLREEVHEKLRSSFPGAKIFSEYGMTELLSQAYADASGVFQAPPWMRILVRDEDDPLSVKRTGKGVLNIIDLANLHSCAFIATDDIGEVFEDGTFNVLGRLDNSDIRGCSLMTI